MFLPLMAAFRLLLLVLASLIAGYPMVIVQSAFSHIVFGTGGFRKFKEIPLKPWINQRYLGFLTLFWVLFMLSLK